MKKIITIFILVLIAHWGFGQFTFPISSIGSDPMFKRKFWTFNNYSIPIIYPIPLFGWEGERQITFTEETNGKVVGVLGLNGYTAKRTTFQDESILMGVKSNKFSVTADNTQNRDYSLSAFSTQSSGLFLAIMSLYSKDANSYNVEGSVPKRGLVFYASGNYLWKAQHLSKYDGNKEKFDVTPYTNRMQYAVGLEAWFSYFWIRARYGSNTFKEELGVPSFRNRTRISIGVNLLHLL